MTDKTVWRAVIELNGRKFIMHTGFNKRIVEQAVTDLKKLGHDAKLEEKK